jgi:ribosomal protein S18 acetylase RimI-like enzyme
MEVHSLGYRTDLIFPRFDGQILDRGNYLVILTPSNPVFYWGNFLLFPDPPGKGDLEKWKDIFAREIGTWPQVEHLAFGWDSLQGELGLVQPFLEAGFNLSQNVVLTARQISFPPRYAQEVLVRPLSEDWEWEQALQNQMACRDPEHSLEGYLVFKRAQMQRYHRMSQAGRGAWFSAFLGKQLVADLGVFREGRTGRFQAVGTHPDYRRRGICSRLVYQASRYALEQMQLETLVMVADENYFAAGIYESIGFEPIEHQVGVDWWKEEIR